VLPKVVDTVKLLSTSFELKIITSYVQPIYTWFSKSCESPCTRGASSALDLVK
jgi:hypothetical protein